MKGTYFSQSLEFKVVTEGETWVQGSSITGTLQVRNHGKEPVNLNTFQIAIADGTDRKVKAKSEDAFEWVEKWAAPEGALAPGAQTDLLPWKFHLPLDARITDRTGSLYLLYGRGDQTTQLGSLQLQVNMPPHFDDVMAAIETTFRFVRKLTLAGKKGEVVVRLSPPDSKEFAAVEQLEVRLSMDETTISLAFEFTSNKVDGMAAGLKIKKAKAAFTREMVLSESIHSFNQRINKTKVEDLFRSVLEESKTTSLSG